MTLLRIAAITIGKRHRKDIGDIAGLARSIETVGLLHPVVVTPAGTLLAGERSVEAAPGGRVILADKSPKAPSDHSARRASQQGRL